jgi:hypothetical protein
VQEEASEVQYNVTCYCIGGNPIDCNSSSAVVKQTTAFAAKTYKKSIKTTQNAKETENLNHHVCAHDKKRQAVM